jgi:BirA family biotin operon repressor/biotin-[acetyl-CoA-carboxylase] ligase
LKFAPNKPVIGATTLHFESLQSSNDYAIELLSKSNPIEGTVISTDFQTHGKGQRNHIWQSEAQKNLLLSIILYPRHLGADKQFYLSMMTACALTSFLETFLPAERLKIKWPNDLYIEDRKIGGILIQNNLKGALIHSTVLGIGLNINQKTFDSSLPNPTSLSLETAQEYKLADLKPVIYQKLESMYDLLNKGNFEAIKTTYESSLYQRGLKSRVKYREGEVKAVILGVEPDGKLIVNVQGRIEKLIH